MTNYLLFSPGQLLYCYSFLTDMLIFWLTTLLIYFFTGLFPNWSTYLLVCFLTGRGTSGVSIISLLALIVFSTDLFLNLSIFFCLNLYLTISSLVYFCTGLPYYLTISSLVFFLSGLLLSCSTSLLALMTIHQAQSEGGVDPSLNMTYKEKLSKMDKQW